MAKKKKHQSFERKKEEKTEVEKNEINCLIIEKYDANGEEKKGKK